MVEEEQDCGIGFPSFEVTIADYIYQCCPPTRDLEKNGYIPVLVSAKHISVYKSAFEEQI